ncbi:MAG: NHL repeat-containing protein [Planctomycetota bacterium]
MRCAALAASILVWGVAVGGEAAPVALTKAPTAKRAGGKTRIEFGVSRETDVAVYVLNAKGEIVRHLAAGVVGKNAPAPLKGGLSQSLEWDGKDDVGEPAKGGPFSVRVVAGMKPAYSGTVFSKFARGPNNLVAVGGLAVRPDGRVYVLAPRWSHYPRRSTAVHVFLRNGNYEKTIKPMPAGLSPERLKSIGAFRDEQGMLTPVIHQVLEQNFYPGAMAFPQGMAVTAKGDLVFGRGSGQISVLDVDGGVACGTYSGASIGGAPKKATSWHRAALAVGSDGKTVYVSGLKKTRWDKKGLPVVYKTSLPERKTTAVFFGDPAKPGNGEGQLGDVASALTCDGKGHLVVCDPANGRVLIVDEKTGKVASKLAIKASWAAIHPESGALYATVDNELVKYASWKGAPKAVARVAFGEQRKMPRKKLGKISVALDVWAAKPVVWIGFDTGYYALLGLPIYPMQRFLYRVEDQGAKFGDLEPAKATPVEMFRYLSADPAGRDEIGCQSNMSYSILNERTGKYTPIKGWSVAMKRLGPDGNIYVLSAAPGIAQKKPGPAFFRYDRSGKKIPFTKAKAVDPKRPGGLPVPGDGTTYWPRDFSVTRKGEIYVKIPGTAYHGLMSVEVFDKDGQHKRRVIWKTTDAGLGPRVDLAGNMYMGESVKTLGQKHPKFFDGKLHPKNVEYWWMYGSLVKFGPEGGVFGFKPAGKLRPGAQPPAGLSKQKVSGLNGAWWKSYQEEMTLEGAKWMKYDFAFLASMYGLGTSRCHCTACDFDVDDFGRSFYPDQGRFRVVVRDTNGNLIRTIGAYGNQDHCGPESYVKDPRTGFMRPRRKRDPKALVSPFAQPEIAFNWFVGMCVTDRNLYVADGANRRVLRVRLGYEAEATCPVR